MDLKELMNLIDVCSSTQLERQELDRKSKQLKKQEDAFKADILQAMQELALTNLNGFSGRTARIESEFVPVATNWEEVYRFIKEHDAFDLLHKRLTVTAVRLRWDDGVEVSGIDRYVETKLVLA